MTGGGVPIGGVGAWLAEGPGQHSDDCFGFGRIGQQEEPGRELDSFAGIRDAGKAVSVAEDRVRQRETRSLGEAALAMQVLNCFIGG